MAASIGTTTRGGLTIKIHSLTDGQNRPLELVLTLGQAGDCPAAEMRFATLQAPNPIEWLSDNGSPYTVIETRQFTAQLNPVLCFRLVASLESKSLYDASVRTFKRDYLHVNPISPLTKSAMGDSLLL